MSIYGIEVALLLVGVLSGTLYHMTKRLSGYPRLFGSLDNAMVKYPKP